MTFQDPEQLYSLAEQMTADGRFAAAELMLRQAVELGSERSDLYASALATLIGLQVGRTEESLKILEGHLKAKPDNPNLLVAYGLTVRAAGLNEEAESSLRQALEKRADHPMALHSLATVLSEKGEIEEAERLACKAFTLVPDHPEFAMVAIELLETQGKGDLAYEVASLGASLNPQEMDLVQKAVEGALARQEPERAWEAIKESDEELPWVVGWKATLLDHQGKVEEANKMIEKGREKFSDDLSYLTLEAAIWARRGNPEEGLPVVARILELDPTNRAALRMRADLTMEQSPEQAVADLEAVYHEEPEDTQVASDLVSGYYKARRYQDAMELCLFWETQSRLEPTLYIPPQLRIYSALAVAALGDAKDALWRSDWVGDDYLLDTINELNTYGAGGLAEEKLRQRLMDRIPEQPQVNPFEQQPPAAASAPGKEQAETLAPPEEIHEVRLEGQVTEVTLESMAGERQAQSSAAPVVKPTISAPLSAPPLIPTVPAHILRPPPGPRDSYGDDDDEEWEYVDEDEEDDDEEYVWVEVDDDDEDEDAEYEWVEVDE